MSWNTSLQTVPIGLFPFLSSSLAVYLKHHQKSNGYVAGYVIFIIIIGFVGMYNWINYVFNPNPFVNEKVPKITLTNTSGDSINVDSFKNKVVILDFWSTACAPCIEGFPKLNNTYIRFKSEEDILIYSVNTPFKRDTEDSINELTQEFDFPLLFISNTDEEQLKIHSMPTVIIIDKNGFIRYRGGIYFEWYAMNNINRLIKKYLNE